jgi:hypothetical protein
MFSLLERLSIATDLTNTGITATPVKHFWKKFVMHPLFRLKTEVLKGFERGVVPVQIIGEGDGV